MVGDQCFEEHLWRQRDGQRYGSSPVSGLSIEGRKSAQRGAREVRARGWQAIGATRRGGRWSHAGEKWSWETAAGG